jgi:hypothetical protein
VIPFLSEPALELKFIAANYDVKPINKALKVLDVGRSVVQVVIFDQSNQKCIKLVCLILSLVLEPWRRRGERGFILTLIAKK